MNINYREANAEEKNLLEELSRESSAGRLCDYSENKGGLFDPDEYRKTGGNMWVAEDKDNNKIVGSIALRFIDENTGKIKALRVHPDYRGHGIAKKLISVSEDYAVKKNRLNVVLGVDSESTSAIGLYEKLGYKKYEEKKVGEGLIYYFSKRFSPK